MHDLRDLTQRVEAELQEADDDVRQQEAQLKRVEARMRHLESTDSLFVSQVTLIHFTRVSISVHNLISDLF